jgi:hypothetical protein
VKGFIYLIVLEFPVQDQVDPLLWASGGGLDGNDREYETEKTAHFMARKQRGRERDQGTQSPLGHVPNDLKTSHGPIF